MDEKEQIFTFIKELSEANFKLLNSNISRKNINFELCEKLIMSGKEFPSLFKKKRKSFETDNKSRLSWFPKEPNNKEITFEDLNYENDLREGKEEYYNISSILKDKNEVFVANYLFLSNYLQGSNIEVSKCIESDSLVIYDSKVIEKLYDNYSETDFEFMLCNSLVPFIDIFLLIEKTQFEDKREEDNEVFFSNIFISDYINAEARFFINLKTFRQILNMIFCKEDVQLVMDFMKYPPRCSLFRTLASRMISKIASVDSKQTFYIYNKKKGEHRSLSDMYNERMITIPHIEYVRHLYDEDYLEELSRIIKVIKKTNELMDIDTYNFVDFYVNR